MPQPPRKRPFFESQPARKRPFQKPFAAKKQARPDGEKGWDQVAAWYDKLVGDGGSDYHRHVVLPATMRLLEPKPGERFLDLCCGQGVLVPLLLESKAAQVTALDASPRLIEAAKSRLSQDRRVSFVVDDATVAGAWADGSYDGVTCLMAVHDVADLDGLAKAVAASLKPGGRFVAVFMHPCFRIPQQTHWGWDEGRKLQFRRIDRYGVHLDIPIKTHPGQGGGDTTLFHHRPLGEVLTAFGKAGLGIRVCEELYSHRRSQAGGSRSRGEHRAAAEFPVFLALEALKLS